MTKQPKKTKNRAPAPWDIQSREDRAFWDQVFQLEEVAKAVSDDLNGLAVKIVMRDQSQDKEQVVEGVRLKPVLKNSVN